MKSEQNVVKQAAKTGQKVRGVFFSFPAPAAIELLAQHNMDFVYIDGEHGCFDWRDIETACVTAERHGLTPIARIPDPSAATITHFLDRGVRGIIVPHIESVRDAEKVVEASYYAPLGNRSFGSARPDFAMLGDPAAYLANCNANVAVSIMIESRSALEKAGELAALDGVDYLSFGMNDLSQALGFAGNSKHPEVIAAVAEASKRIHAKGKLVREDFMIYAWINDVLRAGAKQLFAD